MKILPLVTYPDPLLKQISKPVETVDDNLREFMKNMVTTMYAEGGIGLAAVQVGVLKRVLVMDLDYETEEHDHHHHNHGHCGGVHVKNTNPRFFVNPEIVKSSKELNCYKEGCLSFPGLRYDVTRPKIVTVKYLDFNGREKVEEMDQLLSTCIQHEIDHLNGIVFVDHISKLKREMALKKLLKGRKNG
jgi:peptide deformylase